MRRSLRLALPLLVTAAIFGSPVSASADSGSQLFNISGHMNLIQKQINSSIAGGTTSTPGVLTAAMNCGYAPPTQVFRPWGDLAYYSLAPQGDLSSASQWQLSNATVVSDHDPFTPGTMSVQIQSNGEATTPVMCVNLTNPTIRLFLKGTSASSKLDVSVEYEAIDGTVKQLNLAKLQTSSVGTWGPSVTIPIGVNVASVASSNGYAAVAFQFDPEGNPGDSWTIDNVEVDPFMSR